MNLNPTEDVAMSPLGPSFAGRSRVCDHISCSRPITLGFAALAIGLLAPASPADDAPAKRALFDGRSLDGWKKVETFKAGEAVVDDGSLVLRAGGPMTAVVSTAADLPTVDYELAFEARRTTGTDFFAAATFPVGKSYLTLVNGGWGGSVTGLSSINGADASENDSRRFVKYQNDTWYRFRVHVTARAIRAWIDDRETFAVDIDGQEVKTRIETRGCQPLGFASYRSSGAIRGVTVRKLTKDEVAAAEKAATP